MADLMKQQLADLVGESPGIEAIRDKIARLLTRQHDARRLPPVLIEGETGTGKGLVARRFTRRARGRSGPFVDVNCAAIPETLLEAELFGYERGAFTDARAGQAGPVPDRPPRHALPRRGRPPADGAPGQAAQGPRGRESVRRLGARASEPVDVWIITATNEDLTAAIRSRRFREDLYHRLAVLTLALPPLRERGDDVIVLAEHFLARACADYGVPAEDLWPPTRARRSARYPWPGNVRELANVMERVALPRRRRRRDAPTRSA